MAKKKKPTKAKSKSPKVAKVAKAKAIEPIPPGFHTVTPYLVVKSAANALEFWKQAFGAKERMRMPGPDGRIAHAEVWIGDSIVMLGDEFPEMGAFAPTLDKKPSVSFYLYVPDCDKVLESAMKAGCKVIQPAQDMFWGDRFGTVQDPFGHVWSVATHMRDISPQEMAKAAQEAMKPQPQANCPPTN